MVRTADGNRHFLPFFRLVEEFKKFKTYRCLTCPDWWSGVSDISISDGDPDIYTTSKRKEAPKPSSTILVRTETGRRLLELAVRSGMVSLTDYEFITNLGLERKKHRYRHYASLNGRRIPLPPAEDRYTESLLSDDEVIDRGVHLRQ
jgi:coenzyme F420 hydrogenase subunit beta